MGKRDILFLPVVAWLYAEKLTKCWNWSFALKIYTGECILHTSEDSIIHQGKI